MGGIFPLTLRPRDREPAHAAAARLAQRWGAMDLYGFSRDIGYPLADLLKNVGLRAFSIRAGLDAERVVSDSPVVVAATRTVLLRGQVLRLGDWSMRTRRRCPLCLDEDRAAARGIGVPVEWWATSRVWWDIRSVDVCSRHGVRMTDRCDACGAIQTWRVNLLRCQCGAEHGTRAAVQGDKAVSAYILSSLSYGPDVSIPVLCSMDLVDAIRTVELLGAARLGYRPVKPRRAEEDLQGDRLHGLSLAASWPSAFNELLDLLVVARPAVRPSGLIATYGWLYSEICVGDAAVATAELVAPVLRAHAVANGVMARDEERLGAPVPATITLTETAMRLGRSPATTRRLLGELDAVPEGSRRGVAFTIDPAIATSLCAPGMPPARVLRIGRVQARSILQDPRITRALKGSAPSAADLLDAVLSKGKTAPLDGLTPLPIACRNMSVPLVVACEGVLDGKLMMFRCGTLSHGLHSAWVRQADLSSLRAEKTWIGTEAVARLVGIHHDAALQLVRTGAFGAVVSRRVDKARVDSFCSVHITAAELARERGTSSARFRKTLAEIGISPRFGPPVCRQLIYLRSDIPVLH